jgi:putative heme-binding domain-containing protein
MSPSPDGKSAADARALRHKLEAVHGKKDPAAIDFAWPHLDSPDRWIRYAARIAIESQPVEQWQGRALDETRTEASLAALLALARRGSPALEKDLLQALARLTPDQLNEAQKLEALRVLEVALVRLGRPDDDTINGIIGALDPLYPEKSFPLNRELCQLLVYLEAPDVAAKTLPLLDSAQTQEEQVCYIVALRNLKPGWTTEQRKHYFDWFNKSREGIGHPLDTFKWFADVGQAYHDGASFPNFLKNIRKEAVAALTDDQRAELASVIAGPQNATKPSAVQRSFVKEWKMDDLAPTLDQVSHGRNFAKGKQAFNDAQCFLCHRFGNEGGSVGPDLTGVSSRFNTHDILESILDPSKVVSEQFQNITVTKKDGEDVTGRLVEETNDRLVIVVNPLAPDNKTVVSKSEIAKREASKISPMPEGVANILTKGDILDLIAYLQSNGDRNAAAFAGGK